MDDNEIPSHLSAERIQYTPNTLVTDEAIINDIRVSRQRNYAVDNIEHENNIRCVGVPVLDRNGNLLGALSASGPTSLVTPESVEAVSQKLIAAAFEIRNRI